MSRSVCFEVQDSFLEQHGDTFLGGRACDSGSILLGLADVSKVRVVALVGSPPMAIFRASAQSCGSGIRQTAEFITGADIIADNNKHIGAYRSRPLPTIGARSFSDREEFCGAEPLHAQFRAKRRC